MPDFGPGNGGVLLAALDIVVAGQDEINQDIESGKDVSDDNNPADEAGQAACLEVSKVTSWRSSDGAEDLEEREHVILII